MSVPTDAIELASALYGLFCGFHEWRERALGKWEPVGFVSKPVRSADAEWPHGALLPAVICLLRSRLARIERLRSMRRWHLLYLSHDTLVPFTPSHLSCLTRGRRSLLEWNFYSGLTQRVLAQAVSELLHARLAHGLRQWRLGVSCIEARHAWGACALPRRVFSAWRRLAAESRAAEAAVRRYPSTASGALRTAREQPMRERRATRACGHASSPLPSSAAALSAGHAVGAGVDLLISARGRRACELSPHGAAGVTDEADATSATCDGQSPHGCQLGGVARRKRCLPPPLRRSPQLAHHGIYNAQGRVDAARNGKMVRMHVGRDAGAALAA